MLLQGFQDVVYGLDEDDFGFSSAQQDTRENMSFVMAPRIEQWL